MFRDANRRQPLLRQLIEERVATSGEQPFLTFEDRMFTYGDMDRMSNRVANALREIGVRPNDRVALLLPNSEHFIFCWVATIKCNATMVPLNTQLKGEVLRHVLSNCQPRALITTLVLLDNVLPVRDALPADCRLIVMGDTDDPARELRDTFNYQSLIHQSPPSRPPGVPIHDDDTAMIIYTSGTTGRAKGVMISRRTQTNHPLFYHPELLRTEPGETAYTYLPLFHVTSIGVTMGSFIGGARLALDADFNVFGFWDRVRKHNAVVFPYLGAVLSMLHARPPRPDDADNPARHALGAAAPAAIWRSFEQRFGLELLETYGQSEWGAIWVMHPRGQTRVGAAGKAPTRAEVRVVDERDQPVPPDALGEIVMKPAHDGLMMSGYFNAPELNAQVFRDGWYHTGDMGAMDADGYLYFKGRLKDYIRRRGENISAFEIEQVVNQHPAILESAAVGVPSDLGEEEVKLCAVLRPEATNPPSPEAIWRYCKDKLPQFMTPRYIEVLDALPKTPTQRVRKFMLVERGVEGAWDRKRISPPPGGDGTSSALRAQEDGDGDKP